MPFDARVGNEMTYQAAKPTYLLAGMSKFNTHKEKSFFFTFILEDYKKEEPEHLRPKLGKFLFLLIIFLSIFVYL
jgi:hypothetical protein